MTKINQVREKNTFFYGEKREYVVLTHSSSFILVLEK